MHREQESDQRVLPSGVWIAIEVARYKQSVRVGSDQGCHDLQLRSSHAQHLSRLLVILMGTEHST